MFIAADGDGFRRQFSDGLLQMLSADGLGAFILVLANSLQGDDLDQQHQPFNLLYRPSLCYLLPRKPQGAVAAEKWAQGVAWYESCGVFTLANQSLHNALSQQQITQQLALFNHDR